MTFDELLKCVDYEEVEDFLYNFEKIEKKIIDQTRWHTIFKEIKKDPITGRYVEYIYERGSTEQQDMCRDDMQWSICEVFPKEKTITVYER